MAEKRNRNGRLVEGAKKGNGKGKGTGMGSVQYEVSSGDDEAITIEQSEELERDFSPLPKKVRVDHPVSENKGDSMRRQLQLSFKAATDERKATIKRSEIVEKSIASMERLVVHQQVLIKQMQQQIQQQQQQQQQQSNQFGMLSQQFTQVINTFNQFMARQENWVPAPLPTPVNESPKKTRQTNKKK